MKSTVLRFSFYAVLGSASACGGGTTDDEGGGDNRIPAAAGGTSAICATPPCEAGTGSTSSTGATGGMSVGSGGSEMGTGGNPAYDCTRTVDTSSYSFDANIAPSQMPPGGLAVEDTPLFVALGFDDNPESDGMTWATDFFQAQNAGVTFFHTSEYASSAASQWRAAYDAGFEVANHTQTHSTGYTTTQSVWATELSDCFNVLTGAGLSVPRAEIVGFRAPFLEFNNHLLTELEVQDVWYDSSIQEGFDPSQDGTNLYFPYTLDNGSPGHTYNKSYGFQRSQFDVTPHPGIFELPVYALVVPDDSLATTYSFTAGLRGRISIADYVETGYKITGFDYNLWTQAGVNGAEFLAILKYNFDQRRAGNRAPFLFGTHTSDYANNIERQQAIEQFITYVKTFPEVRVVSYKEVLDFMREPKALDCY